MVHMLAKQTRTAMPRGPQQRRRPLASITSSGPESSSSSPNDELPRHDPGVPAWPGRSVA
eukprot:3425581-Prymnesium_polylepis.1